MNRDIPLFCAQSEIIHCTAIIYASKITSRTAHVIIPEVWVGQPESASENQKNPRSADGAVCPPRGELLVSIT